ncbi:AAA family ATPase [Sellimonas intestinalis]|uniref:AAA family ATPase n=1 Tax=Sellimonas intestinalis TaxID=1653434 RepID=UPI001FADF3EF|nr:MoxR family ATPase [Sellimonas intestinalis]
MEKTYGMMVAASVIEEVKKAVIGKQDCIKKVMAAILAGGHILIEDIPGVGKTTMAVAFSKSMGLLRHRVQFTPDVLPADIVGFSLYDKKTQQFVYQPGAAMCNLLLADEINRTSPKTQSALLEVMEERQVTVDQRTYEVPEPFIVIATENPFGSAGTQMLPESQLDRFMICISMGYPDIQSEIEIVKGNQKGSPADAVRSVMDKDLLLAMQKEVEEVYIHDAVYQYIGNLVEATRNHQMVRLGVSPRGTIALAKAAKAYAYLEGRTFCIPHDVESVFPDVTMHRLFLSAKARAARMDSTQVIEEILTGTKKPKAGKGRIE